MEWKLVLFLFFLCKTQLYFSLSNSIVFYSEIVFFSLWTLSFPISPSLNSLISDLTLSLAVGSSLAVAVSSSLVVAHAHTDLHRLSDLPRTDAQSGEEPQNSRWRIWRVCQNFMFLINEIFSLSNTSNFRICVSLVRTLIFVISPQFNFLGQFLRIIHV